MSNAIAPVIGIQLDLGRQKESIEFIDSFIDFIDACGYNTLYLHLESGIRTGNFQFADPDKSYSKDEIKHIVAYSAMHGVTAVPVIATLGHAEHFVKHAELAHLSEQRTEPASVRRTEFCPSLPETYEFLFEFIRETTNLFAGDTIHVGCDEVFNLGSCPACNSRLENGETLADLFLAHLDKLHKFVTGELGKKMIIWDDMADFLPEIISRIPQDIGMIFWEYDTVVNSKASKFGNRKNIDIFRLYEQNGIRNYFAAPREIQLSNIASMTRYAARYRPAGMYLTLWEHGTDFMYRYYPQIAYAGRLWRGGSGDNEETVFFSVVADLFEISDPEFIAAVRIASNLSSHSRPLTESGYDFKLGIRKYPNAYTGEQLDTLELVLSVLASYHDKIINQLARRILDDIIISIREQVSNIRAGLWINANLNAGLFNLKFHPGTELRQQLLNEQEVRCRQWHEFRPGLNNSHLLAAQLEKVQMFDRFEDLFSRGEAILEVSLMLPDYWGRQNIEFQLRRHGGNFTTVLSGMLKPADLGDRPYFSFYAPVSDPEATELLISSYGYNGIGVVYAQLHRRGNTTCRPVAITNVKNLVVDPGNLLIDDTSWTTFGNRDGLNLLFNRAVGALRHEVILLMS